MTVRVKAWSDRKLPKGFATVAERKVDLERMADSALWQANLDIHQLLGGVYSLTVKLTDEDGKSGEDVIRVAVNSSEHNRTANRPGCDKDNAVGAWPEHGILGTQLGPNKNGRKW